MATDDVSLESVTLHLPDPLMQRARQAAAILQRPVEEVLTNMLAAALPNIEDAPPDLQADLASMTWLSEQELWAIAHSSLADAIQEQLQYLADLQTQRPLTLEELTTLDKLRREYGRVTLCKARAYALLSLRGGRPLLAEEWLVS